MNPKLELIRKHQSAILELAVDIIKEDTPRSSREFKAILMTMGATTGILAALVCDSHDDVMMILGPVFQASLDTSSKVLQSANEHLAAQAAEELLQRVKA